MLSVLGGIAATVATGEWEASWLYAVVDIVRVATTSAAAFLVGRHLSTRIAPPQR